MGQPDVWGEESSALPGFRKKGNQYSAALWGIRLSSTTPLRNDLLIRKLERRRDARVPSGPTPAPMLVRPGRGSYSTLSFASHSRPDRLQPRS